MLSLIRSLDGRIECLTLFGDLGRKTVGGLFYTCRLIEGASGGLGDF